MKAIIVIIDSFGMGALPDADKYGDSGANTALHICEQFPQDKWPILKRLGLGNASSLLNNPLPGCKNSDQDFAFYGLMKEKSPGKDTTTGHWEIAGIILDKPFTTFPPEYPSFPDELVKDFEGKTGLKILGNKAASGTAIIEELGSEHEKTGFPIVYTSADSCFQIAAHEDVIPVKELYRICEIARELCDPYNVGRIIARPFKGSSGNYIRTKNRKDFSINMPEECVMEYLQRNEVKTIGVGKIGDIFNEKGLDESYHDKGNKACLDRTIELIRKEEEKREFIFVNLVDTDMLYGHRRDAKGYLNAVSEVDAHLAHISTVMDTGDFLIVTADHGCDPTFKGTDHTREYVPLLVYYKGAPGKSLGIRDSFADIAATLTDYFKLPPYPNGKSFFPVYKT